jgi:hypothetical protein
MQEQQRGFRAVSVDPNVFSVTATSERAYVMMPELAEREGWSGSALALCSALTRQFPNASFSISRYTDHEEGWSRDLIRVDTGIADMDARMAAEDQFYSDVDANPRLLDAIKSSIISFS